MKGLICVFVLLVTMLTSCEKDTFTMSPSKILDFSTDVVYLDTVFSNTSSSMRTFWIYNNNNIGISCSSIRLERGNQSGFRVNINGEYMGKDVGYQINDIALYENDSIQGFVEITPKQQIGSSPQLIEDKLTFSLASGVSQTITLRAFSWNTTVFDSLIVKKDTTISGPTPILVKRGIRILQGAKLTILPGTTIYFDSNAGIDVYGTLLSIGKTDEPITLRGSRLDRMFSYLPYDRISGQWNGIKLKSDSYNNRIEYTDIHGTYNGILADSTNINLKTLSLKESTIHNCKGYGLCLNYVNATIENSQISNTLNSCVYVRGGDVSFNNCTIAQFYPFDSNRKPAFCFSSPLLNLLCQNTIITGYSDDELSGNVNSECHYKFENCIIRTPRINSSDSIYFKNVIYENVEDTLRYGKKHFQMIDTNNYIYNFCLDSLSSAIDKANLNTALPIDRSGIYRDNKPDVGAFEYKK